MFEGEVGVLTQRNSQLLQQLVLFLVEINLYVALRPSIAYQFVVVGLFDRWQDVQLKNHQEVTLAVGQEGKRVDHLSRKDAHYVLLCVSA